MALKDIKCFVLDMDGTIYLGNQLFDYTKEFLATAEQCGIDIWYYTNNSSKNAKFYINKLKKMGIVCEERKMLISNQVIIKHLLEHHQKSRVYVAGTQYLIDDFEEAGINVTDTDCDVVVMGFDTTLTYEKLVKACDFVRYGATLYGVNMDYNCPVDENGVIEYIPDCGSIAKLVERSTGRFPDFYGKPSRHALKHIIRHTGFKEEELAFVGDRIYTDIAIANGTKALSIMVLTGETQMEDLEQYDFRPDVILPSLEELSGLL